MKGFRLLFAAGVVLTLSVLGWRYTRETTTAESRAPSSAGKFHQTTSPSAGVTGALSSLPEDSPKSADPVANAVARGTVLDSRTEARNGGGWIRQRLVRTSVQPRPVRVVEEWIEGSQGWECRRRDMYLADQLIITTPSGTTPAELSRQVARFGWTLDGQVNDGLYTVRLPIADLDSAPAALRLLASHPEIAASAEMDGVGFGGGDPNDSRFGEQWGLRNTGQSGGTPGADVGALGFWDVLDTTPGMVIAVLDSGLNMTHPDLQNVVAINAGEIAGDGVDNDGNGKIDDVLGWDFVNNDNDPTDDHGHGSNVSGIIAATRNNGQGVSGLINGVHIVSCKILNSSNSGLTSNLIAATTYARLRGVPIMNMSLQSYPYSSALDTEFTACQNAGILLCICAGNQGVNNDTTPNYPSSYPQPNIIAVGNHDRTDVRWSGSSNPSNYGPTSVDLFAPGREILSPVLGIDYQFYTGTSQATPFVTAIATALKYLHPSWKAPEIKNRILSSVVLRPSYAGQCVTGGRLNVAAALVGSDPPALMSVSSGNAFIGQSFTYAAAFSGSPTAYGVSGLPAGLSFNATTGVISGTPATTGSFPISLSASNGAGSANVTFTLNVYAAGTIQGHLVNLSVRIGAGTGDNTLIAGVVVGGAGTSGPKPLLIRGIGPTLTQYGVGGALADPILDFLAQGALTPIASNDNWGGDAQLIAVGNVVGAFALPSTTSKDAALSLMPTGGVYSVKISGVGGTTGIALAEVYDATGFSFGATSPRLVNVSARALVGTGEGVLIAGFVVGGQTPRTVLIRAVGPTLSGYGVGGALADPQLELTQSLNQGAVVVASNDNWSGDAQISFVGTSVGAFGFSSSTSKDAAILVTLQPGVYSAKVSGVGATTGVALVEVYEVP